MESCLLSYEEEKKIVEWNRAALTKTIWEILTEKPLCRFTGYS